MPTYEFECPEGHEFEKFYRSMAGAPTEVACPVCGKPAVRQLSGGAGLVFKGSGFYITDYGKDGKKDLKRAPSSGSAKPSTGDAASPSTDTEAKAAPQTSQASDGGSSNTTKKAAPPSSSAAGTGSSGE